MRKWIMYILILGMILSVSAVGYAQLQGAEPGRGTVANSVYTNPYFGMSVPIPGRWHVMSEEEKNGLRGNGNGENDDSGAYNLLTLFKRPPGSEGPGTNASLVVIAVDVQQFPEVRRGRDYLSVLGRAMQTVDSFDFVPKGEMYERSIGGITFDVMESEVHFGDGSLNQRYYTTIRNGHALTFLMTYKDETDLRTLTGMMDSVRFTSGGVQTGSRASNPGLRKPADLVP